jgi:group I intron endonuclease
MVVYLITNLANGKHYVGKTTNSLKKRWTKHLSQAARGVQTYFHSAIRKHGPETFSIVPLVSILATDPQLKEQERFWIRLFNATDPRYGYNLTAGGDGSPGIRYSAEHRRKISKAMKGMVRSAEFCRKQSERMKGKKRGKYAPCSIERRRKISEALKGRSHSVEHRRRIGEALKRNKNRKGKCHSAETRRKISDALRILSEKRSGRPDQPETGARTANVTTRNGAN